MNPSCFFIFNLFFNTECSVLSRIPIGPSNSSFLYYLGIFGLTVLLESPFYFAFARLQKLKTLKALQQILVLNLSTHPLVHFAIPVLGSYLGWSVFTYICVAEAFAFTVEILLLRFFYHYSWKFAVTAATTANLCSWSVGVWLLVNQLI